MAASEERGPSLGHAELRLIMLLEDLERTVETAEQLANAGLEEEAIRVIDLQRDALSQIPDQVAADVAPKPRRARPLRRLALTGLAATAAVAGAFIGALGLLGTEPANAAEVERRLAALERVADPSRRLDLLEAAVVRIATLEETDPARETLSVRAAAAARRLIDDNRDQPRPDPGIGEQALELAAQAQSLAPAPATDGSPLDDLLGDR